jgi:hypothetical protein
LHGIDWNAAADTAADGHAVCAALAGDGLTPQQFAAQLVGGGLDKMDYGHTLGFVDSAVLAYCPEFGP